MYKVIRDMNVLAVEFSKAKLALDTVNDAVVRRYGVGHEFVQEARLLSDANINVAEHYKAQSEKPIDGSGGMFSVLDQASSRAGDLRFAVDRMNYIKRYVEMNFLPE